MPDRLTVSPLRELTLPSLNAFVRELNLRLDRIAEGLDKGKRSLKLSGDLDANDHRITNVSTARANDDAMTLGQLADALDELEDLEGERETSEAQEEGPGMGRRRRAQQRRNARFRRQVDDQISTFILDAVAINAPPNVAAASAIGTVFDPPRFALENHTHGGVLGAPVAGGNAGEVAFFTSSFEIDGDANLFWDNATKRLGVGIGAPTERLHLRDGNVLLDNTGTAMELRFREPSASGANFTAFKAQTQAADITYTLPAAQGAVDTIIRNDGAGVLSWVTVASLLDADLNAIAALTGTGLLARTAPDTWALRSIAVTDTATVNLTITNADGAAGNPTLQADVIPGGIDHGALGGLLDDDHTQYLLLAGRTGTTNDPTLSTTTDGTIQGSSASGGDLILRSTSHATRGNITIDPTWPGAALTPVVRMQTTWTAGNNDVNQIFVVDNTVTIPGAGAAPSYSSYVSANELIATGTPTFYFANLLLAADVSVSNTNGVAPWLFDVIFDDTETEYNGTTNATTLSTFSHVSYLAQPAFNHNGSAGTFTINGGISGVDWKPEMFAAAGATTVIPNSRGLRVRNLLKFGAGTTTLTNQIGVFIEDLTSGTNNFSLLSEGAAVELRHVGPGIFGVNAAANANLKMDVAGGLAIRQTNVVLVNGANNDIPIGNSSYIFITGPTAAFTTTGFAAGVDGKILVVENTVQFQWTIVNAATSAAANQIWTANGANVVLAAGTVASDKSIAIFIYSATQQKWRLLACRDTTGAL